MQYKNQILFNSACIDLNLIYIRDFLKQGGVITFREFNDLFPNKADSLLVYFKIYNVLMRFDIHFKKEITEGVVQESKTNYFKELETGKINRRVFYNLIHNNTTESVRQDWRDLYLLNENDPDIWCLARECCSETKLLELQWKISHNIFPTGILLKKMKIRNNDLCSFCGEIDSLVHFFVSCKIAKAVWEEAEKNISIKFGKKIELTERNKLFGILSSEDFEMNNKKIINKIILVSKHSISKYKYEKVGNIKLLFEHQLSFRNLLN